MQPLVRHRPQSSRPMTPHEPSRLSYKLLRKLTSILSL